MRIGQNPEKDRNANNDAYFHRIIVPVYIPNLKEDYFKEALDVFKLSLNSLIDSVNIENTAITVINNNSIQAVEDFIYSKEGAIEKYIMYKENRGKVYGVMQEIKATFEPFFTIADADILFAKGWEKAVFEVYENFPKAGTVAPIPCPNLCLHYCNTTFVNNFFTRKLNYGKVITDKDCDLYIQGIGNLALLDRYNRKFNWREKHYYLSKNSIKAIVGSGHFVVTHRRAMFKGDVPFPKSKFSAGYEEQFIDVMADKHDMFRLSTQNLYAYHMGNRLDDNIAYVKNIEGAIFNPSDFNLTNKDIKLKPFIFKLKSFIFRVLYKFFKF